MTDNEPDFKGKTVVDEGLLNPEKPSKRKKFRSFFRSRSKSSQRVTPNSTVSTASRQDAVRRDSIDNQVHVATTQPTQAQSQAPSATTHRNEPSTDDSITELWNVAYEELKVNEPKLIAEYEQCLSYNITDTLGATVALSGLAKVRRREQMEMLVKRKVEGDEKGQWKVPFGDDRIAIRDLAKPIVSVVSWAQEYVGDALEASPYGSLAWAGVCLLLPVSRSRHAC